MFIYLYIEYNNLYKGGYTMIHKEKTACFTGHRELRESFQAIFLKTQREAEILVQNGFRFFGTGGARGFDSLAAEVILSLKEKYHHIHLILVLPFPAPYLHEKGWTQEEICLYEKHKTCASKVVYLQETYGRGCYYRRNRHLVNFSSVCIAYQYKNTGGTAYTTKYACRKGLKIIKI